MQVGISDEERAALIDFLRERIEGDRSRSPRLRPLKTFLTKSTQCRARGRVVRSRPTRSLCLTNAVMGGSAAHACRPSASP
jgi:hypothetical protein